MTRHIRIFSILAPILGLALWLPTHAYAQDADCRQQLLDLYEVIAARDIPDTAQYVKLVNEFRQMAREQNELYGQMQSYTDLILYFSHRGYMDRALEELEAFKRFIENGNIEDTAWLYSSWDNIIMFYWERGDVLTAVAQLHKMRQYAQEHNDNQGMSYVYNTFGRFHSYSYAESMKNLQRALEYGLKENAEGNGDMMYVYPIYHAMAEQALAHEDYDQAVAYVRKMVECRQDMKSVHDAEALMLLQAYTASGNKAKAKEYYDIVMTKLSNGELPRDAMSDCARNLALYEIKYGNPDKAAARLDDMTIGSDRIKTEIAYYKAKGDYKKAIDLQEQLEKITLHKIDQLQQAQMTMANAAYNNQRLESEKYELTIAQAKARSQRNILIGLVALILIGLVALLVYQRSINRKNRELAARIRAQEEAEDETIQMTVAIGELGSGTLTPDQQLFARISSLLTDEAVLVLPDLGRDELAAKLGTNRTYVAQAISACTGGMTVSEYVGKLRIQYARKLLETHPEMSLDEVSEASGFSSRSRFHAVFRKHYDMTPGEFRKAIR